MGCQCETSKRPLKKRGRGKGWNVVAGTLVLLVPKCALCWTAYLSLFGWAGVSAFAYRPWFIPVAVIFFCFTIGRLLWRAMHNRQFIAFGLALPGAALIAWQKMQMAETWITVLAMGLMVAAWIADLRAGKSRTAGTANGTNGSRRMSNAMLYRSPGRS